MTSYEFEVAAKNAVIDNFFWDDKKPDISELELVWFTHVLGNKKCLIWGRPMGSMYAEITYNKETGEMYADIYAKVAHRVLTDDEIKTAVKPSLEK